MPTRVTLGVCLALGCVTMGASAPREMRQTAQTAPRRASPPSAVELLDRYSHGDFGSVTAALEHVQDFDAFRNDLENVGPRWITAGGSSAVPHRRLVAATFALEVADATMRPQWRPVGRTFVDWGGQILSEGSRGQLGECDWWLASVALSDQAIGTSGSELDVTATSVDWNAQAWGPWGRTALDHLRAARSRCPAEPRFQFAEAFTEEPPLESVPPRDREWLSINAVAAKTDEAGPDGFSARVEFQRRAALGHAVEVYKPFLSVPTLAAEAHLRIGSLLIRVHEYPTALEQLRQVEPLTREPFLVYLTRFFAGEIAELTSRRDLAISAYQSALDAVPGAESASTRLAALLMLGGRPADAYRVIETALSPDPLPADPWRLYSLGDARLWPAMRVRLRADLELK